jgi:hypothetical protein
MRLLAVLILVLLVSDSCGEKLFTGDVNCDDCYLDKPENLWIEINVTLNGEFPEIPIVVYTGNVEDNQIVYVDTVYESPYYIYVEADNKYSVKAEYKKVDATLYAVDGTKPRVLLVNDVCDSECYIVKDEVLDARIKKEFLDF